MAVQPLSPRVTVYAFMEVDRGIEMARIAPFKATREGIVSRFGGWVLEGTAQDVDHDDVDELGRLQRAPSVWGGLVD